MTAEDGAKDIERGLGEFARFNLADSRGGKVSGDAGDGHTNAALRRRGLLPPDGGENLDGLTWDRGSWWRTLTPLGREVAALARKSTRVGGGKGKRGPRS